MSTIHFRKLTVTIVLLMLLPLLLLPVLGASELRVELSAESLELGVARSEKLTFDQSAFSGSIAKTEWVSSDPQVAAVTGGTVRGVAPGKATITLNLTLINDKVISDSCEVEVFHPVSNVKSASDVTVFVGESADPVFVIIAPGEAKYQDVTFLSDDEKVATVDSNGVISGVSAGSTTVTVTSTEPVVGTAKPKSHKIRVTVIQKVESISLPDVIEVGKGKSLKLAPTVLPENATNPKLKWETSNPQVVAVGADGTIRGVAFGKATVTATATDGSGVSISRDVEVFTPVTGLKVGNPNISVQVGTSSEPLVVTAAPEDAKYKGVTFESADESIATVDENGVITGVALGKTKIKITSAEPADLPKNLTVNVHIVQLVTGITLDTHDTEVARGKSIKLLPTVAPDDATNPKLLWTSSNPQVAAVSSNGTVSGRSVGTCIITAAATDGTTFSDSCDIEVFQLVTRISSPESTRVGVTIGRTLELETEVHPKDARDKTLIWSSDNDHIASVDQNGVVTGVRIGKAKITATAADGSEKKLDFTVFVEPVVPLEAVKFTRHGKQGRFEEFDIEFKNLTMTRKVTYYEFIVEIDSALGDRTLSYHNDDDIAANSKKKTGRLYEHTVNYINEAKVKLQYVRYDDDTDEYFYDTPVIGTFS